jgi:hypothetical protein
MELYYQEWSAQQAHMEAQDALPAHKRDGYAEKMYDLADMVRKSNREQGL